MPTVGKKKYSYTASGKAAAAREAKRTGRTVRMKQNKPQVKKALKRAGRIAGMANPIIGGARAANAGAKAGARVVAKKRSAPKRVSPKRAWEPNQIKGMGLSAPKPRRTKPVKPRIAKPKPRVKK